MPEGGEGGTEGVGMRVFGVAGDWVCKMMGALGEEVGARKE